MICMATGVYSFGSGARRLGAEWLWSLWDDFLVLSLWLSARQIVKLQGCYTEASVNERSPWVYPMKEDH